jgi:hypothetical protein
MRMMVLKINLTTLGQRETDNINRLITLTDYHFTAENDNNAIKTCNPNFFNPKKLNYCELKRDLI